MTNDYSKYANQLIKSARLQGYDASASLVKFLDWLIDLFDYDHCRSASGMEDAFREACTHNEGFFALLLSWLEEVSAAMLEHRSIDFFGGMYEELFKGKGKASALGQFFTPENLCRLMAEMTLKDGCHTINDCACGSGRTLLAAYEKCDWRKMHFFTAADIDSVSCKMCALNLMAHGMFGIVEQKDTLMNSTPVVVYHINEVRYPFPTPLYSIRREYPRKTYYGECTESAKGAW